jgi:DNA-directed RNA polymerase III subunit RPC3
MQTFRINTNHEMRLQLVLSTLFRHGRLSLPKLAHHSRLSYRQVKHGLVVLIQQHLVLHCSPFDEDATYYEADWKAAYALVRSGKVINYVEERFGEVGGAVFANLLLLGHVKVGELAEAYGFAPEKRMKKGMSFSAEVPKKKRPINGDLKARVKMNGINGKGTEHENGDQLDTPEKPKITRGEFYSILSRLFHAGFLMPDNETQMRPKADNYNEAVRYCKAKFFSGSVKGAKQTQELEDKVVEQLKKWRAEGQAAEGDVDGKSTTGIKRSRDDGSEIKSDRASKKARMPEANNGRTTKNGDGSEDMLLDVS